VWPEGADFNFRGGEHELRIFLARAAHSEVQAIDYGPVEFGLLADRPGLFMIVRFGRSLSFDCSYSWHRVVAAMGEKTLPPPSEETSPALRALLSIVLIEACTGIVLALRAVTFSPEFTRSLHRAIADQAAAPYDPAEHNRWVATMTRLSTEQLWERCKVRCQGGA
jgi:hypothetical protein